MAHHGDEAYERKLRPVYDSLDARSYKQAVKLADAVLKKYKSDQLVRALKGYALYRSGKGVEALQLMEAIVKEGPEAERVAMTMTYTYKAAGQVEGITQAYAAAAERLPRDPEVLSGLFRAHVREFNFVKQQQAAMKLSKLAPTGSTEAARCAWWVVTSLALQARAAMMCQDSRGVPLAGEGASLAPEKLLQLAETMAARQASGGGGGAAKGPALSYEALLLYLDVLQGQGKAEAAVAAVDGPLGAAVPLPADRLQLRAAALVRAGDLPAAAACYRQALAAAPDDWLSWQLFLDCCVPDSGGGAGGASASTGGSRFPVGVVGGVADWWDAVQLRQRGAAVPGAPDMAAVAAAEECLAELQAAVAAHEGWSSGATNGALRAPHLWRCELLLRVRRLGGGGGTEELAGAVGDAFARLCGNFSCTADLRPYLGAIDGAAAEQLAARAHALAAEANAAETAAAGDEGSESGGSGGAGAAVRRLQRLVSAHSLECELGLPRFARPAQAAAHAARLLSLYRDHQHLSAKLDEKDRGYGEELVAMAAGALVAAAGLEGERERALGRMLQAVLVLEAAQHRRKVSAPLRLAAAALYTLLGAPALAAAQLTALDIKSILHDSVTSHWLLPLLAGVLALRGGAGSEGAEDLRRWAEGCAALHDLHQLEAGETLGTALEHGTYSKVPEFVDFKERLQNSHGRALAAVLLASLPPRGGAAGAPAPLSLFPVGGPAARRAALQHARALLLASKGQAARNGDGAAAAAAAAPPRGPVLRFNEDLSTRPSWYPPGSAGAGTVADWWRQQGQQQGQQLRQGYAQCWWSAPLAAEGGAPEATAWQRRCAHELRTRLAWALAASASLDSAADAAALAEQLRPLVEAGPRVAADATPDSLLLQAAACNAVLALLQAVGGGADPGAAAQQLAAACAAAGKHAAAGLAGAQGLPVLPGDALVTAAALACDCGAIAAVCDRLKQLARKGPAAAAAGEAAAAAATAAAEIKAAAAAAAVAHDAQQRTEAAAALVEGCGDGEEGAPLWGFEPAAAPQAVLAALVAAQAAVLVGLR